MVATNAYGIMDRGIQEESGLRPQDSNKLKRACDRVDHLHRHHINSSTLDVSTWQEDTIVGLMSCCGFTRINDNVDDGGHCSCDLIKGMLDASHLTRC